MPFTRNQLFSILASICDGLFCLNLKFEMTFANERCLELLGYQTIDELLSSFELRKMIIAGNESITQTLEAGKTSRDESAIFVRRDGSTMEVEFNSFPVRDESDQIQGAIVSFQNVSMRNAEIAHRNQLARLVESSNDAILSRDLQGRITSWNRGATQIYGYEPEEAIGRSTKLILPPGQDSEEDELIEATQQGLELSQFEVKRKTKAGEIVDISISIAPILDIDGNLVGTSSIERDFTERRRSYEELIEAKTKAERAETRARRASKSRSEFLATVSHELRTPMNSIIGMLGLALEESLNPLLADYLQTAKRSADGLLELINEILDFSKIEAGKFEVLQEPFDIRETVDIPAKTLAVRASEKGLELLCEIQNDIPYMLVGDGRRIQQVLTNLLSNAIKFTDQGEIIVRLRQIKKSPKEVQLEFSVVDSGVGISLEDQAKIFAPFAQADMSSTRIHHGTGLGLAICRELISLMGGKLGVNSELGRGSQFHFRLTLPVARENEKQQEGLPQLVRNTRVLVVDDNKTNLQILGRLLQNWSMTPIIALGGEEALKILDDAQESDEQIALALIDSLMPLMDGFTLAEKMVERYGKGNPPIVIMQSASDLAMYSERMNEAPVDHYLSKPISQSELLDAVVDTLDLYSYQDATDSIGLEAPKTYDETLVVPLNILLVEDLEANQKVAQAILGKRGHQVTTVSNGRAAVEEVQAGLTNYDIILMDIQMPVMDGIQATSAIRRLEDSEKASTPIIAMTAHAMQGDREMCLAAGMDSYLAKPLDAQKLIQTAEAFALSDANQKPNGNSDLEKPQVVTNEPIGRRSGSQTTIASGKSLVDKKASLRRLGNDEDLYREFVEIFLADSPALMNKIIASLDSNNGRDLERAAHALKGMMSNFGAEPVCQLAVEFELAGRENRLADMHSNIEKLSSLYQRLCEDIKESVD